MARAQIPKGPDGTYDREAVKAAFMASPFLDWTRFAEEQGWEPHRTRLEFAVRSWQIEKRRIIVETQGDTLAALLIDRKNTWTREILSTMERYPKLADKASQILEAKMDQIARLYLEYQEWLKDEKNKWTTAKNGRRTRVMHPFERLPASEITGITAAIKSLVDAKRAALMVDKWGALKFDIPKSELDPPGGEEAKTDGGSLITIEGKEGASLADIERWFDEFTDKPVEQPADPVAPTEAKPAEPEKPKVIPGMIDDNGQPIG